MRLEQNFEPMRDSNTVRLTILSLLLDHEATKMYVHFRILCKEKTFLSCFVVTSFCCAFSSNIDLLCPCSLSSGLRNQSFSIFNNMYATLCWVIDLSFTPLVLFTKLDKQYFFWLSINFVTLINYILCYIYFNV